MGKGGGTGTTREGAMEAECIVVVSLLQVTPISVCQQTARHGPRLRPASVMAAPTPTSRIKGVQRQEGCHPPKPQHRSSAQSDRRVYGERTHEPQYKGPKWEALTLTAVQGGGGSTVKVRLDPSLQNGQHLTQVKCRAGGGSSGKHRPKHPRPSHQNWQHLT